VEEHSDKAPKLEVRIQIKKLVNEKSTIQPRRPRLKEKMLKELSKEDFEKQLDLIQRSTREWCVENFILKDEQIEYLYAMPNLMVEEIGLNSRIAIQFDQPLILETPTEYVSPMNRARPREAKTSVEGGGSWNPGTGDFYYKIKGKITLIL